MPSTARSNGHPEHAALDLAALARALSDTLGLRLPPVALAICAKAPEGLAAFGGEEPSACTFWRRAEDGVFFAPAEAHLGCPVGAMTMGLEMPARDTDRLMQLVGRMGELGYVDPEEAASIPSVPGEKAGIVYGPLDRFPLEPDAVLVWVSGRAAMLLGEAAGAARWTPEQPGLAAYGRPSCAAIPVALAAGGRSSRSAAPACGPSPRSTTT